MGQIRKGDYCAGCGQICDGVHLDKELRPKKPCAHPGCTETRPHEHHFMPDGSTGVIFE